MGLLIKSSNFVNKTADKAEKDSPITAIAKLLPAEAIAFFTVFKIYMDKLTLPSEINFAKIIGLLIGLLYVFLSRILALTRDEKKFFEDLKKDEWKDVIIQAGIATANFLVYYLLQMNFFIGIGSPELTELIIVIIGFIWIPVIGFVGYMLSK